MSALKKSLRAGVWKYEPIPRHVMVSEDGTELAEIVLENHGFAGQEIDHHWRIIRLAPKDQFGLVGRSNTLEEAKIIAERRGFKLIALNLSCQPYP